MKTSDKTRIVSKNQIKSACKLFDIPIVMGGHKKVHYIDAFKIVCHNIMRNKFGKANVTSCRLEKIDKILEESWCRKFPEYKSTFKKLMTEPFTISLRMYF